MAEDLALEQRFGNRRAVDRDERERRARAELMDRLRDQLLAGARLAGDEHRRRGGRRQFDHLVNLPHLRAVPDERSEGAVFAKLTAQRLHLAHRLEPLDDFVEQHLQSMDLDRLRQIVVGALLHRLDRALDGPLRGQQQRRHVGGALLGQRAQQCEPVHARHHQVRDDDGGAEGGDLLERLFAVASRLRDEAPAPDELFQPDARSCIVLNDEHTLGRALLFCGHNTVAVHCGCHSTPQPCHFYILGAEADRCKLKRFRFFSMTSAVANSLQHPCATHGGIHATDDSWCSGPERGGGRMQPR